MIISTALVAAVLSFAIIDWFRLEFDISDKIITKRRSETDE